MGAIVNEHWDHTPPMDYYNQRSRSPQRSEPYGGYDSRGHSQKGVRKRPSEMNMHSEGERSQSRRPSVQSINSYGNRKAGSRPPRQKQQHHQQDGTDDSQWIHRDKLAEIEIRELEAAGMRPRQPRRSHSTGAGASARSSSRSMSRNGLRRPMSKERLHDGEDDGQHVYGRKRVSTIPAADEEEHEREFDHAVDSEFRRPEEVAAQQPSSRSQTVRPSTSRIPISTASPVPVPSNVMSRDSPLPRSRAGSGAWSGNWEELSYAKRARSGSVGSQVLLDSVDTPSRPGSGYVSSSPENTYPHSRSPQKARVPTKSTPTSGVRGSARKASGNRPGSSSATKPRERSDTGGRPTSSAGRPSRPSGTINRPEGDAPWLATMYKPDPRLPPDQQMLPTHAKRMREGGAPDCDEKTNSVVIDDTDFEAMNAAMSTKHKPSPVQKPTTDISSPSLSPIPPQLSPTKDTAPTSPQTGNGWPHGARRSITGSETASIRPSTSGGYRITPTINTPPVLPAPSPAIGRQPSPPRKSPTPRIPDFDEKEEPKKKGCLGCVVM